MPHPLHQFSYCPACGAALFEVHNEKSKQCTACGFTYYFNPSAAVACFIKDKKGNLLLVRRAKDPGKGSLDLPGGFVDMNESAEDAVYREIQEETGLVMPTIQYLFSLPNIYPYLGFNVHTLDLFFESNVDSFHGAKAADDAAEIVVLSPGELTPRAFGLQSVRQAVKKYLEEQCPVG
ncbi:MAG: NUDIX domain-containing protein [Tannerellaceae bacterium]|jgi:ADP-ribose pyrophosphatase YjhB (NUDIX family)|nr:NUDIX domain-containing protein [Tannerellaceae bacterium]